MKFERLLKIYWIRGLFFNGTLLKPIWTLNEMFDRLIGFSIKAKINFIKRFELTYQKKFKKNKLYDFNLLTRNKRKKINRYLSQITSLNHKLSSIIKFNIIRLYLIKSFRGRCQMLGKPSRGQRTWSNAWTAFHYNRTLKFFIKEIRKNNKIVKEKIQLNKKFIKKTLKKHRVKIKMLFEYKEKNTWF